MERGTFLKTTGYSIVGAISVGTICIFADKVGIVPPPPPTWLIIWTSWIGAFLILGLGGKALLKN